MFNVNKHAETPLRVSMFGHVFEREGVACGYHSLQMATVYFPQKFVRQIFNGETFTIKAVLHEATDGDREELQATLISMCEHAILVPVAYDEMTYLDQVRPLFFHGPNIRVMVLHLTDFCDLDCRYCFIEGGLPEDYCRKQMTEATMHAALEHFVRITTQGRSFPKRPSIVFYGGEPLLNWKVLLSGLEYLSSLEKEYQLEPYDKILITNGTLLSEEKVAKLKEYGVMASISIDGPQELHDFNRVTKSGGGSHHKVMAGLQALTSVGIQPTVSCVLSEHSIGHEREIAKYLFDELHVRALGFNHVSIVPNVNEYDPQYEEQYADAILNVQDMIQSEYPNVYERRMSNKVNNFIDRNVMRADCTGCGEQISVSTDGEIGICQGYMGNRKTFNNTVLDESFDPNHDEVFEEWSKRSPLNMPECFSCPALATCGGGCPRNADVLHGSIWKRDTPFCHFAQKAQEWMVWKKYDATQT